jgi:4-hydroxybenzoate polyprenyltransferase
MLQSKWRRTSRLRRANFVIVFVVFCALCAFSAGSTSSDPLATVAEVLVGGLLMMAVGLKLIDAVTRSDPPASWGPPGPKPSDPP